MTLTPSELASWRFALEALDPPPDPAVLARAALLAECPTPADLATKFDPTFVRTEAGDLISARIVEAMTSYDGRLTVSQPPQTGKSLTLRWTCVWLLLRDPDTRIVYASYGASLARTGSRIIRTLIETHGEPYGLKLDKSHADAADWQIEGHLGGVYAVGTGGGLTGRACSAMIIDDPHASQADADSQTMRSNVIEWWSAVARTRLAPGAPVVGVATRWHQEDLISTFIGESWPCVNVPAQADGQTLDSLEREPGTYLTTPRGTTVADWAKTRRDVGERTWAALYQGRPAPLEGGVFKTAWFDTWRTTELPDGCDPPVVVVDPADNEGSGDEAGIILAALHRPSGKTYIIDDLSARMTVARWARTALLTCVRRNAPQLAYEQSLSRLPNRIREAWDELYQQAQAIAHSGDRDEACARLSRADDRPEKAQAIAALVHELTDDDVATILRVSGGPILTPIIAKGTKESRMLWAAPLFETGRACMVGTHTKLEHQASTWAIGQASPDRVDAMTHAVRLLEVPVVDWLLDSDPVTDPLAPLPQAFAGRYAIPAPPNPVFDDEDDPDGFVPGAVRTVT